jgi:hypothetical protein
MNPLIAILIVFLALVGICAWRIRAQGVSWATARRWLFYVPVALLSLGTFVGCYLYADYRGFSEQTTVKWMNILLTGLFVFGFAIKKLWHYHMEWKFWAQLVVLFIAHLIVLQRLRWQTASYFWLLIVVGIPELFAILALLNLAFPLKQVRTAKQIADLIERFLTEKSLYPQEWNDFVESSEADARLDSYRRRCYELDPLVNSPGPQDPTAILELRRMIEELRQIATVN